MIPVLREKLASVFETDHFSEEFRSGNGVVDLVFTTSVNKEWLWKNPVDFETVYYLSNHIDALNKKLPFDFLERTSMQKQKRVALLRALLELMYLEKTQNFYFVKKIFKTPVKDIISIEAKIKDWRKGVYQAQRYKYFSNKSFLAISNDYVHRVDQQKLKQKNIGLISVSHGDIEFIHMPPSEEPANKASFNYLATCLFAALKTQNLIQQ